MSSKIVPFKPSSYLATPNATNSERSNLPQQKVKDTIHTFPIEKTQKNCCQWLFEGIARFFQAIAVIFQNLLNSKKTKEKQEENSSLPSVPSKKAATSQPIPEKNINSHGVLEEPARIEQDPKLQARTKWGRGIINRDTSNNLCKLPEHLLFASVVPYLDKKSLEVFSQSYDLVANKKMSDFLKQIETKIQIDLFDELPKLFNEYQQLLKLNSHAQPLLQCDNLSFLSRFKKLLIIDLNFHEGSELKELEFLKQFIVHFKKSKTTLNVINLNLVLNNQKYKKELQKITPSLIGLFPQLNIFRTSNNVLTNEILEALSCCPQLSELGLSTTDCVDIKVLAGFVRNWSQLRYVDLKNSDSLKKVISLEQLILLFAKHCPHLSSLALTGRLDDDTLQLVSQSFPQLCSLSLTVSNALNPRAFTTLSKEMTSLIYLGEQTPFENFDNNLNAIINTCPSFTTLCLLRIDISGNTFAKLFSLKNLTDLSFEGTINGCVSIPPTNASNIKNLQIRYSNITDDQLTSIIPYLGCLKALYLSCTQLSNRILPLLGKHCPLLEHIGISYSPLITEEGIEHLRDTCPSFVRISFLQA